MEPSLQQTNLDDRGYETRVVLYAMMRLTHETLSLSYVIIEFSAHRVHCTSRHLEFIVI
jgi:hypothetical protein